MLYTDAQKKEHIQEILQLLYDISLRDSRIPTVLPSDRFTPEAGIAVRAFQEAYGLPITGEIDGDTWNTIVDTYHAVSDQPSPLMIFPNSGFILQQGDRGELVYLVQMLLEALAKRYENLPQVQPNSEFDAQTADAVRAFQAVSGLPQTGILDRDTWNHLAALVNQMRLRI